MSLQETMAEIAAVAKELNAETDRLNEVIRDFEDELNKTNAGVPAWMPGPFHTTEKGLDLYLGYYKHADKGWCVCVRGGHDPYPLLNGRRHIRMAALPHLAAVAEAVLLEAKRQLSEIKKR